MNFLLTITYFFLAASNSFSTLLSLLILYIFVLITVRDFHDDIDLDDD